MKITPEKFVAIICGSRQVLNEKKVSERLSCISSLRAEMNYDIVEVVSGGCPNSGDKIGEVWAQETGIDLTIMIPNWIRYSKSAGPIRNRRMLSYIINHPDKFTPLVIALWDGKSRGTQHMINIATSAKILVNVIEV